LSAGIKSISFAGAGNVATHLALSFYCAGYDIAGIYSLSVASASVLAEKVSSKVCTTIAELSEHADLVIISVPDYAFGEVLEAIAPSHKYIVHTSGGLDMEVMNGRVSKYGVLYPLQTFSKNTEVSLKKVPFCIEASEKELLDKLRLLASSVSDTVVNINSTQRRILHLSAVFASNFPNSMYSIAEDLLKSENLSFELLHPLILETTRKATLHPPQEVQTGPARRHDLETMKAHEKMLEKTEPYRQIYDLMSRTIQKQSKKEKV
jgi:predicted short-subunit dehydrogenase-like oxidoreductase (DUF2520 family)